MPLRGINHPFAIAALTIVTAGVLRHFDPAGLYPTRGDARVTSTNYANRDAVRAAGAAPIRADEPGCRSALDRDGDGIACEAWRGR